MAAKKNRYIPKAFESSKGKGDTSANIYITMLVSAAWNDLNSSAKVLYVCMKSQYYGAGQAKEKSSVTGETVVYDDDCFFFNRSLAREKFNMKNPTQLAKDIKALVDHGFIQVVKNGYATKTKSIYRLSADWQQWEKKP